MVDVATEPSERPGAEEDDPRSLLRKEDGRLLTGAARFVDDLAPPGALHATILRSPHAHARIAGDRRRPGAGASPASST